MITHALAPLPRPLALAAPVRMAPAPQLAALDSVRLSSSGKTQFYSSIAGAVGGSLLVGMGTAHLAGTAATITGAVSGAVAIGTVAAIAGGMIAVRAWGHHDLGDLGLAMGGALVGGGAGVVGGAIAGGMAGVAGGNVLGFAAGAVAGAAVGYIFGKGLSSH
jgi:hypothetical protein